MQEGSRKIESVLMSGIENRQVNAERVKRHERALRHWQAQLEDLKVQNKADPLTLVKNHQEAQEIAAAARKLTGTHAKRQQGNVG